MTPGDIFVIQSAMEQYKRKYPKKPAPSAEVALASLMERRKTGRRGRQWTTMAGALLSKMFESLRFLLGPLSSASR